MRALHDDPAAVDGPAPAGPSSERLFLAFAERRDPVDLERLLRTHLPQAYALATRILGNDADADDALQEALVRLVQTCDRYDGSIAFGAWLSQLVRHAAIDQRRSRTARARREHAIAVEPEVAPTAGDDDRTAAIRRAVAELPEQYRAPIELHYYGQLSQEETAQALGLKENAVAQRISRARERLRASLGRSGVMLGVAALIQALAAPTAAAREALAAGRLAAQVPTLTATAIARAAAEGPPPTGWTPPGAGRSATGTWITAGAIAVAVLAGIALIWWRHADTASVAPAAVAASAPAAASVAAAAAPTGPIAVAGAPSSGSRLQLGSRFWSFDSPDHDLAPVIGSWHHEAGGGIAGSGSMVLDADEVLIPLPQIAGLKPPLRLTVHAAPLPPAPAKGLYYLTILPDRSELAQYGNVGNTEWLDVEAPTSATLRLNTMHVSDDAIDNWSAGRRNVLAFYRRNERAAGWSLIMVGRWRLDELRVEEVQPDTLPDVQTYREAAAAIAPDRRTGIVEIPGLTGSIPTTPVTIKFATYPGPPEFR